MKLEQTNLKDVYLIKPTVFNDERGYFFENYKTPVFKDTGIDINFVQDNVSKSSKGTLRGLHYQDSPAEQDKLVHCMSGCIFDVAVDIRPDSPTYKQWTGIELSDENHFSLLVPKGFAHGFYVLSDTCIVSYKCSEVYTPEKDRAIRWDDPELDIQWPIEKGISPKLSQKDMNASFLNSVRV